MPERGQSPPPERSTGKQMHTPPGTGKGTDDASNKEDLNKASIEVGSSLFSCESIAHADKVQHLTSNPRGPLEDEVEKKFEKGFKPEKKS